MNNNQINSAEINSAMINIYNECSRAYFLGLYYANSKIYSKPSTSIKNFILQGVANIHLGKIKNIASLQKFLGKFFPEEIIKSDDFSQTKANAAFLYTYHCLKDYMNNSYLPDNFQIVGVAAKLKSRVPLANIYLKDIIDLILWNNKTKTIELVNFNLLNSHSNTPWPSDKELVMTYLCQKLKLYYPFNNIKITNFYLSNFKDNYKIISHTITDRIFELHFPKLVQKLISMNKLRQLNKTEFTKYLNQNCDCSLCPNIEINLNLSNKVAKSA